MERESVLSVNCLSKSFHNKEKELIALDGISFELYRGEVLGIIGRNGAGKSTLLKILSRISAPSSGVISFDGELTSILDVGTGFHSDLSGKENVYLSAVLHGYKKQEIHELYDKIVAFSGLEEFMDMPVKHYSSGMYLRLAFSIAFHANISILLLDEVIAVGDTDFKRKCYSKIKELKSRGVAIILVSHHLELIVEQCDRCLLLDDGKILQEGEPLDVVNEYYEILENNADASIRSSITRGEAAESFCLLKPFPIVVSHYQIDGLKMINPSPANQVTTSSEITLEFTCTKFDSETSFELGMVLVNLNGVRVLLDSYGFRKEYEVKSMESGKYAVRVTIPADLLSAGVYRIDVILCVDRAPIHEIAAIAKFRVFSNDDLAETRGMGSIIRPKLNWSVGLIEKK